MGAGLGLGAAAQASTGHSQLVNCYARVGAFILIFLFSFFFFFFCVCECTIWVGCLELNLVEFNTSIIAI